MFCSNEGDNPSLTLGRRGENMFLGSEGQVGRTKLSERVSLWKGVTKQEI